MCTRVLSLLMRPMSPPSLPSRRVVVAGEERRAAFLLRDGGTLLVSVELPQMTERRLRERVVASVGARLRVARDRKGDGERR